MSAAAELLAEARAAGVLLEARGERLIYDAPEGVMTPALLAQIRQHKGEIIRRLQAVAGEPELDAWGKAPPTPGIDRPDVITVVEDLADEGMRPGRISRELGLTRGEVIKILQRTGR